MGFLSILWSRAKQWLWAILMALGVLLYVKGRDDGWDAAKDEAKEDLIEDLNTQKEIRDEVSGLGVDDLTDRLQRWVQK